MLQRIRLVVLASVVLLCLGNPDTSPEEPPEPWPVVAGATVDVRKRLEERQEWLARESAVHALHKVTGIPDDRAREVVGLVLQETEKYENFDFQLVLGLIIAESGGNQDATSPLGARGLMQIMPATGQFVAAGFREEWKGRQSLYEVGKNIRYGVWYLNHLRKQFPDDEQAMVAAYNWGPLHIRNRLAEGQTLPKVYPRKVWDAGERIRKEMYDFYRTHSR